MKRMRVSAIVWGVFLVFFIVVPAAAAPVANLNLVDAPSGIGDTFGVEVWVDGDNIALDLVSFGFNVSSDNSGAFNYTGYTLGAGFDDDSFGSGNVAGSAFPGIMQNDVLLATLFFETLAAGTGTLNAIGLYDGQFSGIYYELEDFSLVGYDIDTSLTVSTVPISSAIILLFSGLIGIFAVDWKAKRQLSER